MSKRVLIVEDNPFNLELLSELIQAEGHQVITAMNGPEALSTARAERPDLIFMDMQLPGLDGLTVTRTLMSEPPTRLIPIVGISAHILRHDEEHAIEAGCVAYLSKPIDRQRLIDLMARLMGADPPDKPAHRRG